MMNKTKANKRVKDKLGKLLMFLGGLFLTGTLISGEITNTGCFGGPQPFELLFYILPIGMMVYGYKLVFKDA